MRTYNTFKEVKDVMKSFAITWDVLTTSTLHVYDMEYYIGAFAELFKLAKRGKWDFTEKLYIRERGVESVMDSTQNYLQCLEIHYNHKENNFTINAYKL